MGVEPGQERTPSVTAVVVSYFTGPVLARSLASLGQQPEITEIILVDNGNFNGDIDAAINDSDCAALVRVISGQGNIGFAAGCNLGARLAQSDYVLIFNPDAIMPDGGIVQMLVDAEELERPWLMGAKLVGPDGVEQQGSRRRVLTPGRAFVEATRLYRLAPQHPYFQRFNMHTSACPDEVIDVPTISGAVMFLPLADYMAIGGMDEHYFMHVEDVDFCLRFSDAGGTVYFNPHVPVVHFKSSSRANPVRIEARKTAGIIRYFHKHFSNAYPRPFLWLVDAALWVSFGLLFVKRAILKALRLVGFGMRRGERGLRRARSLSKRQSER
ncbi:glycosyltransferase family 2 protein [Hyphococcus formosus]|uniref:glycosyltransferase n=1 Tax=Hyphococcus formosus TaxID=3143534 RepID=UPI00398B3BF5